jgi:hypothetical protein
VYFPVCEAGLSGLQAQGQITAIKRQKTISPFLIAIGSSFVLGLLSKLKLLLVVFIAVEKKVEDGVKWLARILRGAS